MRGKPITRNTACGQAPTSKTNPGLEHDLEGVRNACSYDSPVPQWLISSDFKQRRFVRRSSSSCRGYMGRFQFHRGHISFITSLKYGFNHGELSRIVVLISNTSHVSATFQLIQSANDADHSVMFQRNRTDLIVIT